MKPEGAIFLIMFFGVVASTIWATVDAAKQERYKYKGYNGAFIVFLGCAFCWIIFFPIYLFI